MWQEPAVLRDFNPAFDRFGSVALHRDVRDARGMFDMPPIAIESVPRNETLLRANKRHISVLTFQCQ
jgi:hypothetical protein